MRHQRLQRRPGTNIPHAAPPVVAHGHDPLAVGRETCLRHEAVHETDVHKPWNESSRRGDATPVNVFPRGVALLQSHCLYEPQQRRRVVAVRDELVPAADIQEHQLTTRLFRLGLRDLARFIGITTQ